MDIEIPTPYEFVEHAASIYGWKNLKEILGISKQGISNWKLGKREPNAGAVLRCVYMLISDGHKLPKVSKTPPYTALTVKPEISQEELKCATDTCLGEAVKSVNNEIFYPEEFM